MLHQRGEMSWSCYYRLSTRIRIIRSMLEVSLTCLALGMIYVGKCDDAVGGKIVQRLMKASDEIILSQYKLDINNRTCKHYRDITINDSLSL